MKNNSKLGTTTKIKRSAHIAAVLAKHGIDLLGESNSPWRHLAAPKKWFSKSDASSQPEQIRKGIEELGATFIKLGQAVSTRPDIVPASYAAEFAKLQDDAPPVPLIDIVQVFEEEFGHPPDIIFAYFKPDPLAAASIGQVHSAILPDGTQVVVKVQRPGVADQVEEDLAVMRDMSKFLANKTDMGKLHDIEAWFDEFEFTLRNELVYSREGYNAERFRRNFEGDSSLHVPKIYWEYTSDRVLTMERIQGIKVDDLHALDEAGIDRHQLACTSAMVILKMIYDHGFFHADPHPGNFFVMEDGSLGLMDTGMVGRFDEEMKDSLMRLTIDIARKDAEALTDEVLIFAQPKEAVNRWRLKRDIERMIFTHFEQDPSNLSMAALLNDMLATAGKHGLALPSTIALLARCLAMSEGMGRALDPGFNLTQFAEPYLEELITKRYSRESLMERARYEGPDVAALALDLPKKARRIINQIERGDIRVSARLEDSERLFQQLQVAANRLSMSMLVAGMIAGLSVLTVVFRPPAMGNWVGGLMVGMLALIIAAGVALFVSIWRTSK